jgi:hypothetical protein
MKRYSYVGLRAALTALLIVTVWVSAPSASTEDGPLRPLDHFMCYGIASPNLNVNVQLEDQFDAGPVDTLVLAPNYHCNPARKFDGEVNVLELLGALTLSNRYGHLEWYRIKTATVPARTVQVDNQFGTQTLQLTQPRWLAVPTVKDGEEFEPANWCGNWWAVYSPNYQRDCVAPPQLDHYKCYIATGASVDRQVSLWDQFEFDSNFVALAPLKFCNPVEKTHNSNFTGIVNSRDHLVCYDVARTVHTENQFGTAEYVVRKNMELCVPSEKIYEQNGAD